MPLMAALARRRLRGKQPPPAPYAGADAAHAADAQARAYATAQEALKDEAWAEVAALSPGAQRRHVHYTHVRTHCPADRQPEDFTREQFWKHLELVYKEAYPEGANPSGSILLFGAVAKEAHAAAEDGTRDQHHHVATYCSERHYWNRIAKISYEHHRVKLDAKAHDGYFSMYAYLTRPSTKKPLSELDAEVYLSPLHPRGDALRKLLAAGEVHWRAVRGRDAAAGASAQSDGTGHRHKRFRAGDVFGLVRDGGVTSTLELQSRACASALQGDMRLAEFCVSMGEDRLTQLVHGATAVVEAPQRLLTGRATRMDMLRRASADMACVCRGTWIPGAKRVLENNNEDVALFCRDVCRALEHGATRGTNIAVIGAPGCGKSMLFEPFVGIFDVAGKPQSRSSFPLSGILDASLLLWQDFKHDDRTIVFEDLLNLLVGELLSIRVPHQRNVNFQNKSPMFFTSNSPLAVVRQDPVTTQFLNGAMQERFCTRVWSNPLPAAERVSNFPKCSRCCATFYLQYR